MFAARAALMGLRAAFEPGIGGRFAARSGSSRPCAAKGPLIWPRIAARRAFPGGCAENACSGKAYLQHVRRFSTCVLKAAIPAVRFLQHGQAAAFAVLK